MPKQITAWAFMFYRRTVFRSIDIITKQKLIPRLTRDTLCWIYTAMAQAFLAAPLSL
jgi:hypothetical protein